MLYWFCCSRWTQLPPWKINIHQIAKHGIGEILGCNHKTSLISTLWPSTFLKGAANRKDGKPDPSVLAVFHDYIKLMPLVAEANQMSKELKKVSLNLYMFCCSSQGSNQYIFGGKLIVHVGWWWKKPNSQPLTLRGLGYTRSNIQYVFLCRCTCLLLWTWKRLVRIEQGPFPTYDRCFWDLVIRRIYLRSGELNLCSWQL